MGSIKTVVGHTEGTAGIAGLLKCSLAVQNGIVPPNMLLEKLSSRVEPFCKHLRVPREATPWPAVTKGQPRRASCNSFGKVSAFVDLSASMFLLTDDRFRRHKCPRYHRGVHCYDQPGSDGQHISERLAAGLFSADKTITQGQHGEHPVFHQEHSRYQHD